MAVEERVHMHRLLFLQVSLLLGCANGGMPVAAAPLDAGAATLVDAAMAISHDAGAPSPDAPDAGPVDAGPAACLAPRMRCDGVCRDLEADPEACGACGRRCELDHAVAACEARACAVFECEPGFIDCDADPDNGCETADVCIAGTCGTSCGSTGTRECGDVCAPVCRPPSETCNLVDDDCDGSCDEGAGCRVGIHRAWGGGDHFYTRDRAEAMRTPYSVETLDYFHLYDRPAPGLVPFYRCRKGNGKHYYTRNASCDGHTRESVLGHLAEGEGCGAVPLYQLFRSETGDHLYTTGASERDAATRGGYAYQRIAGYVWRWP